MNLTDSGRAFYHQSVRILEDVLEAELATSQAHATLKGNLKIALPSTFGLMHMEPTINEFLQAHPNIEFDLDFNDRSALVQILKEYTFNLYLSDLSANAPSLQRVRAFVDFLVKKFEGTPYWDSCLQESI